MADAKTIEQLVELRSGAIVEDLNKVAWQKQRADRWGNAFWYRAGSTKPFSDSAIGLPATILAYGPAAS